MSNQESRELKQRILRLGLHKFEEEALFDQVQQAINRPKKPSATHLRRRGRTSTHLTRVRH